MTDTLCTTTMLPMVENNAPYADFANRLNSYLKERDISITQLMQIAQCTYEMARRYTLGRAKPRDARLSLICDALGITESELNYGVSGGSQPNPESNAIESKLVAVEWESSNQDKDEFITVPLIDVELSAGNGAPAIVEVEQYELPFRRYTLNKQGVSPNCAKVARVVGRSMSPVLNDGDVVGIDTSKTKIIEGDTYAIRDGELLRVKILIERHDGGLLIRSYNHEEFPDEILTKEQRQERVTVLGRVWWSSKLW